MRIVVIGCGAAGWAAAAAARKTNREAKITVIEQGKHPVYERGGIPYVIQGEIPSFESLVNFSSEYFDFMKIEMLTETKATDIDPSEKWVKVSTRSGKERQIEYDALILATGSKPFIIPAPGYNLPEVYGVRTIDDGKRILDACRSAKAAVVIGARLVGLEMAVALNQRGLDVTVIELLPQILDAILDRELAEEVQKTLEGMGIRFVLEAGISEILGKDHVKAALAGSTKIDADMVVMAAGVRGRIELAQQIGAEFGTTRLIKVDERMETSVKEVYAAGDCIECVSAITMKPTASQLGTNAVRQGKVAGTNAAGGSAMRPPILGASVTKLLETEISSIGLTEAYARKNGIDCVSASAVVPMRPICYPDRFNARVKLSARKADGRIIGAQFISRKEAAPRIDTISVAMLKGVTADDLVLFDHAYSPPVADSTDPLAVVAEVLSKKFTGLSRA
ncbi:MAG: FAD-dependent oxidoreductase [Candidatus Bathyarchaeota archaeon]|nr:MAG: FAD-dependent oxidoreductase [Candidatus Bathyarchaeota archaeon]